MIGTQPISSGQGVRVLFGDQSFRCLKGFQISNQREC